DIGKAINQYDMKVIIVGTFTSCIPRKTPNATTCTVSDIWNIAEINNKEDAIATTSKLSFNCDKSSKSKYSLGNNLFPSINAAANTKAAIKVSKNMDCAIRRNSL